MRNKCTCIFYVEMAFPFVDSTSSTLLLPPLESLSLLDAIFGLEYHLSIAPPRCCCSTGRALFSSSISELSAPTSSCAISLKKHPTFKVSTNTCTLLYKISKSKYLNCGEITSTFFFMLARFLIGPFKVQEEITRDPKSNQTLFAPIKGYLGHRKYL